MDTNPLLSRALALEPVELSTPGADAARTVSNESSPTRTVPNDSSADAKARRDLHITTTDEFLAEAAREYQEDHIDSALWRRAADQCGNDASLVIAAYLRARATALQQKQDERLQGQTRRAGPMRDASDRKVESKPHGEIVSTKVTSVRPRGMQTKLKYLAAAAAALAFVGAVVWLIASPRESESVRQPIVSAAAPSPNRSTPPIPLGSELPLVKATSGGTNQGSPAPTFATTVQQMKNDGKWNVLVLYASEWARKEPNNAAAWYELSVGYFKLRQLGDAFDAATKAVQLSPEDALLWRNLGHVNLAVESLPEAGFAFDRALAVKSDDADALCGAALVAQRQGRSKDADAFAKRVKSVDGSCLRVSDGESAAVAAGGSTAHKPVLSVGR
jgi:tetratricopeptide (TPR) repeat protein